MPSDRVQILFRVIAAASVVSAFGQVALGGVVRVTGSGLGCPDWPLCHGKIIPPFDTPTLIEYSHRMSGTILGLLVIATVVIAWMRFREDRVVMRASVGALALVIIAGLLGGVTVLSELEWWFVLLHLGVAELLIACLTVAVIAGWNGAGENRRTARADDGARQWTAAAVAGAFALILSGSYMVGYGAGSACGDWPLCRGSLLPAGTAYVIHMAHRYVAAIVGAVVLWAAWRVWRTSEESSAARFAAAAVAIAFAAQVVVGAAVIWMGFSGDIKATHLSMATLVWIALVCAAALAYLPERARA